MRRIKQTIATKGESEPILFVSFPASIQVTVPEGTDADYAIEITLGDPDDKASSLNWISDTEAPAGTRTSTLVGFPTPIGAVRINVALLDGEPLEVTVLQGDPR